MDYLDKKYYPYLISYDSDQNKLYQTYQRYLNPYQLFHNLYYEDTPHQMLDITKYDQKILKVIVRKKSDPKKFEKYIDKLYSSNLAELKIVENFDFTEGEEFEADESEDTISLLNRYIQESEVDLDKSVITEILQDVYREACEVE